jgi:hypothetical protein
VPLDTRPLTDRVDRRAVREYRRTLPEGAIPTVFGILNDALLPVGLPSVLIVLFLPVDHPPRPLGLLVLGVLLIPATFGVVQAVRAALRRSGVRQYRLHRFAEANGLTYLAASRPPRYPGMVLTRSSVEERVRDRFMRQDGMPFDLGDHSCKAEPKRHMPTHRWGYVMIPLPTRLPHIVLDSRSNDSLRHPGLPEAVEGDQLVSLEGDFDRHFTLYCPKGYERDALYLFTPDVMARFIDTAAGLDVEIIEDALLMYSPGGIVTTDAAEWERLLATVEAVQEKVVRWGRWRDANPDDGSHAALAPAATRGAPRHVRRVAEGSRRLKLRPRWWFYVKPAAAVAYLVIIVLYGRHR